MSRLNWSYIASDNTIHHIIILDWNYLNAFWVLILLRCTLLECLQSENVSELKLPLFMWAHGCLGNSMIPLICWVVSERRSQRISVICPTTNESRSFEFSFKDAILNEGERYDHRERLQGLQQFRLWLRSTMIFFYQKYIYSHMIWEEKNMKMKQWDGLYIEIKIQKPLFLFFIKVLHKM
jgi:hypothetical protein